MTTDTGAAAGVVLDEERRDILLKLVSRYGDACLELGAATNKLSQVKHFADMARLYEEIAALVSLPPAPRPERGEEG